MRLGADDYVVKPAMPDEVVARVHAILRRPWPGSAAPGVAEAGALEFGRLVINMRAQ